MALREPPRLAERLRLDLSLPNLCNLCNLWF
jgi:hypothetical protein